MRIPVTLDDLSLGRFTKIARALQKVLPNKNLGLMRAQSALAVVLGYRDLHDLQSSAIQAVRQKIQWSRSIINNAVSWQLSRHHGVDLNTASALAEKLHLQMLDVDATTSEAASDRMQKEYKAKGLIVVRDEAWDYFNPSWNERTPALLDAHIPGYSFAVLPDKTVFRWPLLEDLLNRLPDDFADDLREDPRYKHFGDGKALEMAFIKQELYSQACTSLLNAAKVANLLPTGYKIKWIFADCGGHMGECIGRVLHNEALGGIIPVIYPKDTDDIFEAVGKLLCGETIAARVEKFDPGDVHVYTSWFGYGGYDLVKHIRPGSGQDKIETSRMDQLSDHIRVRFVDGCPTLVGCTFVENGQTYLRHQNWMVESDIPSTIGDVAKAAARSQSDYLASAETIPSSARMLTVSASSHQKQLFGDARANLQCEQGIAKLIELFFGIVKVPDFDTYCVALMHEDLPLRGEDDAQDSDDLIAERADEVERMSWNGGKIKEVCPALAPLNDATLGYVLLWSNGEYPGGRNSSWVYPPQAGDFQGQTTLLLGLVVLAICCISNRKAPGVSADSDVLAYVVNRVLDGVATIDSVLEEYFNIDSFSKHLAEQEKFIEGVEKWREADAAIQAVRARGEFLYVGEPVGREKPKGLAELFAMSRSAGFKPMLVEQNLSDFHKVVP